MDYPRLSYWHCKSANSLMIQYCSSISVSFFSFLLSYSCSLKLLTNNQAPSFSCANLTVIIGLGSGTIISQFRVRTMIKIYKNKIIFWKFLNILCLFSELFFNLLETSQSLNEAKCWFELFLGSEIIEIFGFEILIKYV